MTLHRFLVKTVEQVTAVLVFFHNHVKITTQYGTAITRKHPKASGTEALQQGCTGNHQQPGCAYGSVPTIFVPLGSACI